MSEPLDVVSSGHSVATVCALETRTLDVAGAELVYLRAVTIRQLLPFADPI
jgi:hypothetical protein